jgi:threonine aldolase
MTSALARRLADGLRGIQGLQVEPPQTNILFVDLVGPARERSAALIPHLAQQGVLATGLYRLRFVTHLDVDASGVDAPSRPSAPSSRLRRAHAGCATTSCCSSPPGCC